jgi:hypothetical protein
VTRRWIVAVLALALLTACGGKRDLGEHWPAMPAAKVWTPAAGDCATTSLMHYFGDAPSSDRRAANCTGRHEAELVAVKPLFGTTDPEKRAAFGECSSAASAFVGGDWHTGWLGVRLRLPTKAEWAEGVRTYSCWVFVLSGEWGTASGREGTLKGALVAEPKLRRGCADMRPIQDDGETRDGFWATYGIAMATDCTIAHTGEEAGLITLPDAAAVPSEEAVFDACYSKGAEFLGLSVAGLNARTDLSTANWQPSNRQWALGDRTVHCFVVLKKDLAVKISLKGLGAEALPV